MAPDVAGSHSGLARRLAQLVGGHAQRVYPDVLEQHGAASISSPLGVRLLLAACAQAAEGDDLGALERASGCPAVEAGELLRAFLAVPPPALARIAALHGLGR